MKTSELVVLLVGLSILMLTACTSSTPYLDQNRGKAFEQARYSQIINPEAKVDTEPIQGLDGRKSTLLEKKYHETFTTKQPRPVYNLNMPGVTSK